MDDVIAFLFFVLCLVLIFRMLRGRDAVDFQMGVIATFSIGYYCLPIWFKARSPLIWVEETAVTQAILIFFLFCLFIIFGTWTGRRLIPKSVAFTTPVLDRHLTRYRLRLAILAFCAFLYYYFTQDVTSYTSSDREIYFEGRGLFSSIIAAVAGFGLAWMALCVALSWRDRSKRDLALSASMLAVCIFLLLFVGQRLAILNPIVMLMASLIITGQRRRAIKTLAIGILVLLIVSPIAVFIRESLAGNTADSARHAVRDFSYESSGNAFETMLQSIIDRSDLVEVSARMLPRVDSDPLPGLTYYGSVLLNPVPRFIFPGNKKPYPLSTNGESSGELSVYSWRMLHSDTIGSLSAFGGIVAYRELRWPGVILNGIANGILFVLLFRWLGKGGFISCLVYINIFVAISVKKAPPSFWESMLALMPYIPFLIAVLLLERALSNFTRSRMSFSKITSPR